MFTRSARSCLSCLLGSLGSSSAPVWLMYTMFLLSAPHRTLSSTCPTECTGFRGANHCMAAAAALVASVVPYIVFGLRQSIGYGDGITPIETYESSPCSGSVHS